jgi:hypothetical protein
VKTRHLAGAVCAACLTAVSFRADAALLSRVSGQAYYDDVRNVTWVADGNLAKTSGFDADGAMSWTQAQSWITSLNAASYLGVNDWRLATTLDTGTPGCNFGYSGTDCGYHTTGELADFFYGALGNTGIYDTSGVQQPCGVNAPTYCLTNTGPFAHMQREWYWYGTEYAPNTTHAWVFDTRSGYQTDGAKFAEYYAWAVRSGDIGAVPEPGAAWLMSCALALFAIARRR